MSVVVRGLLLDTHTAEDRPDTHTLRPRRDIKVPVVIRPRLALDVAHRPQQAIRLASPQRIREQVTLHPRKRNRPQVSDHRLGNRPRRRRDIQARQRDRRIRQPQPRRILLIRRHTTNHLEPRRLKRRRIETATLIRRIINPGNDQIITPPRRTRRRNRHLRLRPRTARIRLSTTTAIRIADQSIPRRNPNRRARNRQRSHLEIARVNDPLRTRRSSSEHSPHHLSRMLEPATHKIGHTLHSHKYTLLTGGKTPESPKQSHAPSPSDPSP